MSKSNMVYMRHPNIAQDGGPVTRSSFEKIYQPKGFEEIPFEEVRRPVEEDYAHRSAALGGTPEAPAETPAQTAAPATAQTAPTATTGEKPKAGSRPATSS